MSTTKWSELETNGADRDVPSNWLVYDTPFYAMAPGLVVGAWRNAPENTLQDGKPVPHPDSARFAPGGNHLWILQDDGLFTLYAHAKPGSIPSELCPHEDQLFPGPATGSPTGPPDIDPQVAVTGGAHVTAGQFLGRIGFSGAVSEPHLHVHMEASGNPIAMPFDHGMTTPFIGGSGKFNGPWTLLAGKVLPEGPILIWAPRPVGDYTFLGTPAAEFQGLFDHLADSGMMPDTISCKNNGATYDANWIPATGLWVSHWGMSATGAAAKHALYTKQGFTRTSSFTCGTKTVAVWRK